MKRSIRALAVLALTVAAVSEARAGFTPYTDQSAFNAAVSGLSTQNFNAAVVDPSLLGFAAMNNPLDANTSNGVFKPGDILPGLTINGDPSPDPTMPGSDALAVVTPDAFVGLDHTAVFANVFGDPSSLILGFSAPQTAVSLGLLSLFDSADITVTVGSTVVGTITAPNSGTGAFFGIIADGGDSITSITLTTDLGNVPGIDSVQFAAVPEPSTLISGGMAGLLGLGYGWRRRLAVSA